MDDEMAAPRDGEGMDMGADEMAPMMEMTDEEAMKKAKENQAKMNAILEARRKKQAEENPDLKPEDIDGPQRADGSYILCSQFWFTFVICVLVILLGQIQKAKEETCGIDPVTWVQVYFGIILLSGFAKLFAWFFMKCGCSPMCILTWIGVSLVICLYLAIAWIIIGYMQYFSPENDCQSSPGNFGWLIIMVIFLFFGFGLIIAGLVLICFGCCAICYLSSQSGEPSGPSQTQAILDNPGAKFFYDPSLYNTSNQCIICMEEYKAGDKILVLPCNEKHYFHDACIQTLVDNNDGRSEPSCPICRTPIGEIGPEQLLQDAANEALKKSIDDQVNPPAGGDDEAPMMEPMNAE